MSFRRIAEQLIHEMGMHEQTASPVRMQAQYMFAREFLPFDLPYEWIGEIELPLSFAVDDRVPGAVIAGMVRMHPDHFPSEAGPRAFRGIDDCAIDLPHARSPVIEHAGAVETVEQSRAAELPESYLELEEFLHEIDERSEVVPAERMPREIRSELIDRSRNGARLLLFVEHELHRCLSLVFRQSEVGPNLLDDVVPGGKIAPVDALLRRIIPVDGVFDRPVEAFAEAFGLLLEPIEDAGPARPRRRGRL